MLCRMSKRVHALGSACNIIGGIIEPVSMHWEELTNEPRHGSLGEEGR